MTIKPALRSTFFAATAASALVLAGCSSSDDAAPETSTTPGTTASAGAAAAPALETVTEGKLTIATGQPAYSPWVENDAPESGEGFEAAVAYAVAEQLGYAEDDVVWVRASFDSSIAPGPKDWDLNLQQFSVTEERKVAVDFSSPYYTTTQAVVTDGDSAAASATTVAELAELTLGVASGTTSYNVAVDALGDGNLSVFNSNEDAAQALVAGQIDAFVIDLPSAFYLAAAELDNGVVLGQFADNAGGDEFAIVLPKDSALTPPVTDAVDALREDGTLDAIEQEWLSDAVDVPVLN